MNIFRLLFGGQVSSVAREIADAFLNKPLASHDLDAHGISEMSTTYAGKTVAVAWYSSGRIREVVVDGETYPGTGVDCAVILRAAKDRAGRLLSERFAELERASHEHP